MRSLGKRLNLVKPPASAKTDDRKAKIATSRAAVDQFITGYGSSIDIPRTELAKGAKFGELITPQALTFAVRREPVAKRLVMDVAEDLFDKWFTVHPIATGEEKPDPTLNASVQTELERLNARLILVRAAQYERRYGWSIIVLGFEDQANLEVEIKNATRIDHLATYSPRAVSVEKEDEDPNSERFGLPVIYKINIGKAKTLRVHYSRVLHIATRLDEHAWAGVPILESIWDDMTVYRNMRWAAGQVYWRLPGILVFKFPENYSKEEIQNFFSSLGDPNVRTFIGLPKDKEVDVLGAKGRVLSPEEFIDPIMRSISMGASIPKQKLEGTEAGAVTGSEVNQREYYKYVSGQQKLYEAQMVGPLIDKLQEIGQVKPDIDYVIEWASGFQLDLATEAAAKLADAQAAGVELRYMTVDEVRAKRNLKPISDITRGKVNGQVLLSLLEIEAKAPGITVTPSPTGQQGDQPTEPAKARLTRFREWFDEAVKNFGK
jgi:phage-related protein (TIGR01555 family)